MLKKDGHICSLQPRQECVFYSDDCCADEGGETDYLISPDRTYLVIQLSLVLRQQTRESSPDTPPKIKSTGKRKVPGASANKARQNFIQQKEINAIEENIIGQLCSIVKAKRGDSKAKRGDSLTYGLCEWVKTKTKEQQS